jgi:hypothetical protein
MHHAIIAAISVAILVVVGCASQSPSGKFDFGYEGVAQKEASLVLTLDGRKQAVLVIKATASKPPPAEDGLIDMSLTPWAFAWELEQKGQELQFDRVDPIIVKNRPSLVNGAGDVSKQVQWGLPCTWEFTLKGDKTRGSVTAILRWNAKDQVMQIHYSIQH